MMIHECGHALTGMVMGWHNSISFFGRTIFLKAELTLTAIQIAQESGLSPEELVKEQALNIITELARRSALLRYGVIGGWIGQLLATLVVFLVFRSSVFQTQASSFSRTFWGGFILFNLAWLGGTWFLYGVWTLQRSDPIVLVEVIMERNPFALIGLWIVSMGLVGLALFVANRYGGHVFGPLGLSEAGGQRLALFWTGAVVVSGLLIKLPMIIAVLINIPLMIAIPLWELRQLVRQGEHPPHVPGYIWLGTLVVLAGIIFMLLTNSGILIGGDPDTLEMQVIQAHYCEQIKCVPEDIMRWLH
jgi:hypothetical protein